MYTQEAPASGDSHKCTGVSRSVGGYRMTARDRNITLG